jgi:hypothetical protein
VKHPDYGDVLKIGRPFSSVKGSLLSAGVQIPSKFLGLTNGARIEAY